MLIDIEVIFIRSKIFVNQIILFLITTLITHGFQILLKCKDNEL